MKRWRKVGGRICGFIVVGNFKLGAEVFENDRRKVRNKIFENIRREKKE